MTTVNSKNEKVKRRYLARLREADGLAESTVVCVERAIGLYEDFTCHEDYARFNHDRAVNLKKRLMARRHNGESISLSTTHHDLRHLKRFFTWLADQPGYKSRVSTDHVSYLSLDRKSARGASAARQIEFPQKEYVERLADSIVIENEIDLRDRAMTAFLLESGMRDRAIATLPLGCFDPSTLRIEQNPALGVHTKFGKSFASVLFRFSDRLIEYILEWAKYLQEAKLFSPVDPLFPRSKVEHEEGGLSFVAREVDRSFWKGTGPIRTILAKRCARAGLPYFHPHTFRHAAIYLARKQCRNAEEIKAVSQNFGHEDVGTTMMTYGTLDDRQVLTVIGGMDFSGKRNQASDSNLRRELESLLDRTKDSA
jgi:integrase